MPDIIDRIAKIICPEAWDRDEFRRIVKRTNGGHTTGIDVEASMEEARNAARQTARDVLTVFGKTEIRSKMIAACTDVLSMFDPAEDDTVEWAEEMYQTMMDAALAEQPAAPSPMEVASESVAQLGLNNGVKQ